MIVAITGHRPEGLQNIDWVYNTLQQVIAENDVKLLVQGMAAGVDLMSAAICIELGIPFVCAKPWAGHTPRTVDEELYSEALKYAQEIVDVSESVNYIGPFLYHNRNEYMVNRADTVIAVWSGVSSGGTAACVRYAKKEGKRIIQINPLTQKVTVTQDDTLF